MSQVGLAEQIWTHLSKMFPKMLTEMRGASKSSSCTHLPLLPLAFLPRAIAQEVSSPLFIRLSFATFQEEASCERDFSVPVPAFPLPSSLPSQCCSPPPQNILLHIPMAQEASFLSLSVKPVKPSGYFLSLLSFTWRTLPDKALLFFKWFWHRVS